MKAFLVATILEFFLASIFATPVQSVSQYGSRIWQTENGLPENNILAVCQTADDFLWIATPQCLTRFDSAEFKTYDWPTILKSKGLRTVTTLLPDRNGALWIGTTTNELIEFRGGSFQTHVLPANTGVISLFQQDDDSLWIGTTAGLMRMRKETFSSVGSITNEVLAISGDTNDLWLGTERGLKLLEIAKGTSTVINNVPGAIRTLRADQDGGIWIGTRDLLF